MSDLTRAEIEEFWETWLEVNREAERIGDWRIMAEWYAEDATYGWMYTPDEHFMAVGRDQIRDWAIGIEMDGLDGWHYDYQATADRREDTDGRRLLEAAVRDHRRRDRQGVRDPRHRRLLVRRRAAGRRADAVSSSSPGSATGSTCRSTAHTFLAIVEAGKAPEHAAEADVRRPATACPATTTSTDLPSPVWPPPVERGDYITQEADAS